MRILVTGGAGFIGSEFVRSTLRGRLPESRGTKVTVLDKLTYSGNLVNLAPVADLPGFRFVRGDICDPAVVDEAVAGQDAIVHFAAETHVDRSIVAPAQFVTTNVLGTQTLLEAAVRHGVPRFLHASTGAVPASVMTPGHDLTGTRLGEYEVSGVIGEGGMGRVYRAHDTRLDRDVALKVVLDAHATEASHEGFVDAAIIAVSKRKFRPCSTSLRPCQRRTIDRPGNRTASSHELTRTLLSIGSPRGKSTLT